MRKLLLLFMILGLGFSSCRKNDTVSENYKLDNAIFEIQKKFQNDSLEFYKTFDRKTYNYRQSLTRVIHWQFAKVIRDTLVVPITLKLADGTISSVTGENSLPHKTYLIASKGENSNYNFSMQTFIESTYLSGGKFTGTILDEDYFLGNVKYANYSNGIKDEDGFISSSQIKLRAELKKNNLVALAINCSYVRIGSTCVGDVNGGSAPDVCSDRIELQCNSSPNNQQSVIYDFDNPGGGGGSSSGDNPFGTFDCAGIFNGFAKTGECGRCIGGTTGISSCKLDLQIKSTVLVKHFFNVLFFVIKLLNCKISQG